MNHKRHHDPNLKVARRGRTPSKSKKLLETEAVRKPSTFLDVSNGVSIDAVPATPMNIDSNDELNSLTALTLDLLQSSPCLQEPKSCSEEESTTLPPKRTSENDSLIDMLLEFNPYVPSVYEKRTITYGSKEERTFSQSSFISDSLTAPLHSSHEDAVDMTPSEAQHTSMAESTAMLSSSTSLQESFFDDLMNELELCPF